jgi:hypothetical protein
VNTWFRRLRSFEEEANADAEFWAQMTPDERVAIVEQLRAEWLKEHGRSGEELRRTLAILRVARR